MAEAPLVEARDLRKEFGALGRRAVAVDGVSLAIAKGETLGLAGSSAAGKSTVGRMILGLVPPSSGTIRFEGRPLERLDRKERLRARARMQMVFQNPMASMNPRRTAGSILELPLRNFGLGNRRERRERVLELLELLDLVGLSSRHVHYYPHEFSGGQCQRLGIARALASNPSFIFLDEPVSALDVSIQAQILNLLKDLQERLELTYLFVANNLSVARFICDQIVILDRGRIVEEARNEELFSAPRHPITRQLLASIVAAG